MDVYGKGLSLGLASRDGGVYQRVYADRRCVQLAITDVGLVSATRCLQSALPLRVQVPKRFRVETILGFVTSLSPSWPRIVSTFL